MLGWLKNLMGVKRQNVSLAPSFQRQVRAAYDVAQTVDENTKHWANADALSPDAAASPGVRKTIRERARYECQENNSYAKGIVLTLASDVVGTGPRLQLMTDDGDVNKTIEDRFAEWGESVHLPDKLRTLKIAKTVDGEGFAQFIFDESLTHPVKLNLATCEADLFASPYMELANPEIVDGIRFDEYGHPIAYHRLRQHPGGDLYAGMAQGDWYPAEQVIHLFRCDRSGQHRGISEIAASLPLFAQLRRYTLAVIAAAETAADLAAVMKTTGRGEDDIDDVDALDAIPIERRVMVTLPKGWDITQIKSEQPATTYEMFKRAILCEIARCLNMPYNIAAGDSAGYNYSSGRLDHQTYFKSIAVEQDFFARHCLDRIFARWFREASLVPGYLPLDGIDVTRLPYDWMWDGTEHVDPLKEANADEVLLKNHMTTLKDVYARKGRSWEDQLHQRAKEVELQDSLGLLRDLSPEVSIGEKAGAAKEADDGE